MDVGVWLLNSGAKPQDISWVMPRDSWLVNRITTQPGEEFFVEAIGGQVKQMDALAQAIDINDMFDRMEACGAMLRIDPNHRPTMFHYATMSSGEVELLRTIKNVIRMGHVQSIEPEALVLDQGRVELKPHTLCIDCTASAVEKREAEPIFQGNTIVLQLVRVPQPAFSAAMVAYVEAHYDDEAQKNKLCGTVPFPDSLASYPKSTFANMMNQFQWSQDKALRQWIRESRLDGFGKLIASVDKADVEKQAIVAGLKTSAMAAMANITHLMAAQRS